MLHCLHGVLEDVVALPPAGILYSYRGLGKVSFTCCMSVWTMHHHMVASISHNTWQHQALLNKCAVTKQELIPLTLRTNRLLLLRMLASASCNSGRRKRLCTWRTQTQRCHLCRTSFSSVWHYILIQRLSSTCTSTVPYGTFEATSNPTYIVILTSRGTKFAHGSLPCYIITAYYSIFQHGAN